MKPGRASSNALAVCILLAAVALLAAQTQAQAAAGAALTPSPGAHDILVMLRIVPEHARPNESYGGDYGDPSVHTARRRQAQQIAKRHGLELIKDGWPMPLMALDCFVMRARDSRSLEAAAAEVSREPMVAWSQPINTFQARDSHARTPLSQTAGF